MPVTSPASSNRLGPILLGAGVCVAIVVALTRGSDPAPAASEPAPPRQFASAPPPATPQPQPLPVGHPLVGAPGSPVASPPLAPAAPFAPAAEASLAWTAPPRWTLAPHASAMRIATYRVPHALGDTQDPELSVIRAGGDAKSNADRWIEQFGPDAAKTAKQSERTVGTLHVVLVEARGPFQGMTMPQPEPGFMLLGAIVETPDQSHFFKLTGPEKSVEAARAEFDSFVASVKPKA